MTAAMIAEVTEARTFGKAFLFPRGASQEG
jgi:hypothetical protein